MFETIYQNSYDYTDMCGIGVSVTYLIREIDIQPSQMTLNDDNQFGDWKRDGRLTHGYGTYNHGLEFEGNDKHYGNDYDLPENTEVLAATDGVVTRLFEDELGGKVIQISESNGQYHQWYMHLNDFKVTQGQKLKLEMLSHYLVIQVNRQQAHIYIFKE